MTEDEDIRPSAPLLTSQDLASPTWVKLKKHMEAQLEKLRRKNENDLDPVVTAHVRGQIKAARDFLALGKPNPGTEANEELRE
jgi:hypothetical protein